MDFIQRAADGMSMTQRGLDVVGNNLANLQTTGYRAQRITYQSSESGNVSSTVSVDPVGGQLQATHVPTDMGIQGDGFFIVQGTDGPLYTRDGSFHLDANGNLLFGDQNLHVMGYGASNGTVNSSGNLVPINIPVGKGVSSHGSTTATASGNLDASAAVYVPASGTAAESGGVLRTQMTAYDSQNNAHSVNVTFTKTASNTWSWSLSPADAATFSPSTGQIVFDANGQSTAPSTALTLNAGNGASTSQALTLDFGQLTQTAGTSNATLRADAFQSGSLSSFTVGTDGTITGQYSTGSTVVLGRIPLAHFSNPDGLRQIDGNLMAAGDSSGTAQIGTAGSDAFGSIEQGNLEGSNVDITAEFSRMIISQRAYQANSRLVQTGNEMWQDLMNIKQ